MLSCILLCPLFFFQQIINYSILLLPWHTPPLLSGFPFCILLLSHILGQILLTDESDEEEEVVVMETKEEKELGVIHRWIEVGALHYCPRMRHGGYCVKYVPPLFNLFPLFLLQSLHLSLIVLINLPFFISGVKLVEEC